MPKIMGPSVVSILTAMVSPMNWCVTLLCLMSGLTSMATPEQFLAVLCSYVMYGCNLMVFVGVLFVCASSIMSGLSSVYMILSVFCLLCQPFTF